MDYNQKLLKKIKDLSFKMRTQNNLATQCPLWVVTEKVQVWDRDGDERERKDPDMVDDISVYLCEDCLEKQELGEELPSDCEYCDDEAYDYFRWNLRPRLESGMFFTRDTCQAHIDANDYHYCEPKTYAWGTWRNPEMQLVMEYILSLTGEIPSHYKSAYKFVEEDRLRIDNTICSVESNKK